MRAARLLAAAAACSLIVMPAFADTRSDVDELNRTRDELVGATEDLASLDARLDAARADLDEVEARLDAAGADLATVRQELAAARATQAEAAARAAEALRALRAATTTLEDQQTVLADSEDQLASRVRDMWKHQGTDPGLLLMEGMVTAESLHDATVLLRTVRGIVDRDADLVSDAVEGTREVARSRAAVAGAQRAARDAEARAAARTRRVADLVNRQERLVAAIATERDTRAALLGAIEQDRLATARLVEQLRDRVAALAAALADALLAADPGAGFDGPVPAWASALPGRGRALSPAIVGAAHRAGVNPRLFAALVWSESNFHPAAVSHAGAIGLAQLMPGTAAGLGVDPWDPYANLVGGARYLRVQLERFGSADLALAAYNAGPARVEAAGRTIPAIVETQVYVLRVLERFETLAAAG